MDKEDVVYTHTHTHTHSAIKKNEILSFVITWVDLESTTLNEKSQVERKIPEDFTYMWNLKNKKNRNGVVDTKNKQMVGRGKGVGGRTR